MKTEAVVCGAIWLVHPILAGSCLTWECCRDASCRQNLVAGERQSAVS